MRDKPKSFVSVHPGLDVRFNFNPDEGKLRVHMDVPFLPMPLDEMSVVYYFLELMQEYLPFFKATEIIHRFSASDCIWRLETDLPLPGFNVEVYHQRLAADLMSAD